MSPNDTARTGRTPVWPNPCRYSDLEVSPEAEQLRCEAGKHLASCDDELCICYVHLASEDDIRLSCRPDRLPLPGIGGIVWNLWSAVLGEVLPGPGRRRFG